MSQYYDGMGSYWNSRFKDENMIWGEQASKTAEYALKLFNERNVKNILVPGAGYGRNTKLFTNNGYTVKGVEISDQAVELAKEYDNKTLFIHSSVLDATFEEGSFDAIYCFNVLHLFRENERRQFLDKCYEWLEDGGYIFFTAFSTEEKSYGKGAEVEKNTFESKPGRPVHYFSDEDIKEHFHSFNIIETGLMEDHENHGEEGPHVHTLRYIFAQKKTSYEFDGEKYRSASKHQKEWGDKIISCLKLSGNERILDLGCGDGVLTKQLSDLVPEGSVLGIDASRGMIETARMLEKNNLAFKQMDISDINYDDEFDVIFSNAALHWVKDHNSLIRSCHKALKKGGVLRFNFAGDGNCSNFYKVVKEVMNEALYIDLFKQFIWPWYMPDIKDYKMLLAGFEFTKLDIWEENQDRYFMDEEEMVKWIEQPSIIPFLKYLDNKSGTAFKNEVINRMIKLTKQVDGRCFETFRRINVYAVKD